MPKKCKKGGGKHQKGKSKVKKLKLFPWEKYTELGGGVGKLGNKNYGANRYELYPLNIPIPSNQKDRITTSYNKEKIIPANTNYVLFTRELNKFNICRLFTPDIYEQCPEAHAIIKEHTSKNKKEDDFFATEDTDDDSSEDEINFIDDI